MAVNVDSDDNPSESPHNHKLVETTIMTMTPMMTTMTMTTTTTALRTKKK